MSVGRADLANVMRTRDVANCSYGSTPTIFGLGWVQVEGLRPEGKAYSGTCYVNLDLAKMIQFPDGQPGVAIVTFHAGRSELFEEGNHSRLPAVAEAAPAELLRTTWPWLVKICEEYHAGANSSVLYQYTGYCLSLEERPSRPGASIPKAFCAAIDAVAANSPDEFIVITRRSWSSENAVVHRLLIRGLCLAVAKNPGIGLEYLAEDRRRFSVDSYESGRQSASMTLIATLATHLDRDGRLRLEQLILSWSMYRDGIELSQEQREWDREARLCLLTAIPPELLRSALPMSGLLVIHNGSCAV